MSDGSKPRVLALLHLPPPVHGLSLKNQRMLDGGLPDALDLRVVRYRFARSLDELGRTTPRKLLLALLYLVRVVFECVVRRPDVGYLTSTIAGAGLLRDAVYMNVLRLFRVPYILHVPAMGLPGEVSRLTGLRRRLVDAALRDLAAVIALNQVHADELARVVPAERIALVPNALPDLDQEGAVEGHGGDGSSHPGPHGPPEGHDGRVPVAEPSVVFLSNLMEEKGPLVLLEALPAVLARVPGVRVTLAGGWPDPATRETFRRRAEALGVTHAIRTPGSVGNTEKLALFDDADLFVFPSWHPTECCPNVVIEAMRHGLPMVATRVAGVPELVEDGHSALLVPLKDHDALAEAMVRLLTDRALAERLGRQARADYEARHRQGRWERDVLELIRRITNYELRTTNYELRTAEQRNSGTADR